MVAAFCLESSRAVAEAVARSRPALRGRCRRARARGGSRSSTGLPRPVEQYGQAHLAAYLNEDVRVVVPRDGLDVGGATAVSSITDSSALRLTRLMSMSGEFGVSAETRRPPPLCARRGSEGPRSARATAEAKVVWVHRRGLLHLGDLMFLMISRESLSASRVARSSAMCRAPVSSPCSWHSLFFSDAARSVARCRASVVASRFKALWRW